MDPCFDNRQTQLLSYINFDENAKLFFSALEILLQMTEQFFKQTKIFEMQKWDELNQSYELIKERVFGLEALVKDYFIEINKSFDRDRVIELSQNLERLEVELEHKNEEITQLKRLIESLNEEKKNGAEIEENLKKGKTKINQNFDGKIQRYSKWKFFLMLTTIPIFLISMYKQFFKW